jgi:hypothetical protein
MFQLNVIAQFRVYENACRIETRMCKKDPRLHEDASSRRQKSCDKVVTGLVVQYLIILVLNFKVYTTSCETMLTQATLASKCIFPVFLV